MSGNAYLRPWLDDTEAKKRLSVERIAGWTVAIAMHVVVVMVLFMPPSLPEAQIERNVPDVVLIVPQVIPPPPPPPPPSPPPPPEPKKVVIAPKAPPQRAPTPPKPRAAPKPAAAPPIVVSDPQPTDVPVDRTPPQPPTPARDIAPAAAQAPAPQRGGGNDGLVAVNAPKPPYPPAVARTGFEGTVILRITVGPDGRPTEVSIQKSSGNRDLDRSARDHVKRTWRFQSTGQVQIGILPIDYRMQ